MKKSTTHASCEFDKFRVDAHASCVIHLPLLLFLLRGMVTNSFQGGVTCRFTSRGSGRVGSGQARVIRPDP